jgi:hypothetical protein
MTTTQFDRRVPHASTRPVSAPCGGFHTFGRNRLHASERKAEELQFWVKQANTAKSETVLVGLVTMDLQLQQAQWAFLRQLVKEWEEKTAAGLPFILVCSSPPSGHQSNQEAPATA